MNIDPNTNLPELPEGYFWRITKGYYNDYLYLELRRKKFFGSEVTRKESVWRQGWTGGRDPELVDLSDDEMAVRIRYAAQALIRERDLEIARATAHDIFVGDYPPKRLG